VRKRRLLVVVMWLLVFAHMAQAQPDMPVLKYDPSGSNGWYPYYIDGPEPSGIAFDAVQLILARAKIQGQPTNLPPKRTNLAFKDGLIDFDLISPDWLPDDFDKSDIVFSLPIIQVREHVVFLPGQTLSSGFLTESQRFKPRIAVVRGYYYHNPHLFIPIEFNSEREVIKALQKKRVALGISGDLPALYWAKELNTEIELGPLHSNGFLHLRLRREKKALLRQINNAITALKKEQAFKKIIHKYTK